MNAKHDCAAKLVWVGFTARGFIKGSKECQQVTVITKFYSNNTPDGSTTTWPLQQLHRWQALLRLTKNAEIRSDLRQFNVECRLESWFSFDL